MSKINNFIDTIIFESKLYGIQLDRKKLLTCIVYDKENIIELNLLNLSLAECFISIFDLHELKVLNLSENSIVTLYNLFNKIPKLEKLIISGNKISELPDTLLNLDKLRVLDIERNRISNINILVNNKNLEILNICDNPINFNLSEYSFNRLKEIIIDGKLLDFLLLLNSKSLEKIKIKLFYPIDNIKLNKFFNKFPNVSYTFIGLIPKVPSLAYLYGTRNIIVIDNNFTEIKDLTFENITYAFYNVNEVNWERLILDNSSDLRYSNPHLYNFDIAVSNYDPKFLTDHFIYGISDRGIIDEEEVHSTIESSNIVRGRDKNWVEFRKLREIEILDSQMKFYPEMIPNLVKVTFHKIKDLHISFAKLNKLTKLKITKCRGLRIDSLPDNLKELHIINCGIKRIPKLSDAIEYLNLKDNRITEFPDLRAYSNLKYLDISNNSLKHRITFFVPPSLKILNISNNHLSEIFHKLPIILYNFNSSLQELHMENCFIFGLKVQYPFSELKILNLKHNFLERIDLNLLSPKLQLMKLDNNNIRNIPQELWRITTLKEIYLSNNKIKKLDMKVNQLINLKVLTLHNNLITELPKIKLPNLNIFTFDYYKINYDDYLEKYITKFLNYLRDSDS